MTELWQPRWLKDKSIIMLQLKEKFPKYSTAFGCRSSQRLHQRFSQNVVRWHETWFISDSFQWLNFFLSSLSDSISTNFTKSLIKTFYSPRNEIGFGSWTHKSIEPHKIRDINLLIKQILHSFLFFFVPWNCEWKCWIKQWVVVDRDRRLQLEQVSISRQKKPLLPRLNLRRLNEWSSSHMKSYFP